MPDHRPPSRPSTVVVLLFALLATGCTAATPSSSGPGGTPVPITTPVPSPGVTAIDAPEPTMAATPDLRPGLKVAWAAVSGVFPEHAQASGLARLPSGEYLAFGQNLQVGGEASMAASSTDGTHWMSSGSGLSAVPNLTLVGAASLPTIGIVAVGSQIAIDSGTGVATSTTGVAYLRRPGVEWTRVADQASLQGAELQGVIATADRFVAFGGRRSAAISPSCDLVGCLGPAIWVSSDGLTWTLAKSQAPGSTTSESIRGVVADKSGFLAYGQRSGNVRTTILWVSTDGRTWSDAHPAGIDGIALNAIVATPSGYLGVTGFPVPGPTVFRSSDRVHWTPTAPGGPALEGIIVVDGGFIAWNNTLADTNELVTAAYGVWTSLDGATWVHVDRYDEFYSGGMVADGRSVLSIGSSNDPNPAWIGTLTVVPPG